MRNTIRVKLAGRVGECIAFGGDPQALDPVRILEQEASQTAVCSYVELFDIAVDEYGDAEVAARYLEAVSTDAHRFVIRTLRDRWRRVTAHAALLHVDGRVQSTWLHELDELENND
jgi:hypothetical protein